MTIIDIHCHILPGMDDGPDSIEESINMAEAFAASGVEHVFATPHHLPGTAWSASSEEIQKQLNTLQKKLQQKKINLTLHPGMEAALHRHLLKELDSEQLLPLGQTDCYLLEPPFQGFRNDLIDILLSFKDTGRDIILAHPERIPFFQKKINVLTDLVKEGIMLQINIGSLLGKFGKNSATTALNLAQQSCIHFVASDAHGSLKRTPPDKKDWRQLNKILGTESARAVCYDNPARLLGIIQPRTSAAARSDIACHVLSSFKRNSLATHSEK